MYHNVILNEIHHKPVLTTLAAVSGIGTSGKTAWQGCDAALSYLRAGGASTTLNCGCGRGYSVLQTIEAVRRVWSVVGKGVLGLKNMAVTGKETVFHQSPLRSD